MKHPTDPDPQIIAFPGQTIHADTALDALPDDTITRWTPSAKKAVLDAIRLEAITVVEACKRFNLSAAELDAWDRRERMYGRNGLMTTQISRYRRAAQHGTGSPAKRRKPDPAHDVDKL
ncbi:MAG: DUF1153 domain-containing protein [Alphaproteobacteria bacterium]